MSSTNKQYVTTLCLLVAMTSSLVAAPPPNSLQLLCPENCTCVAANNNRFNIAVQCSCATCTTVPGSMPSHTKDLDVSRLPLGKIDHETFLLANLTDLEYLDMSNCQISSISDDAFVNITKLKVINLSNNNLSEIVENAFRILLDLKHIMLSGNNVDCDQATSVMERLKSDLHVECENKNTTLNMRQVIISSDDDITSDSLGNASTNLEESTQHAGANSYVVDDNSRLEEDDRTPDPYGNVRNIESSVSHNPEKVIDDRDDMVKLKEDIRSILPQIQDNGEKLGDVNQEQDEKTNTPKQQIDTESPVLLDSDLDTILANENIQLERTLGIGSSEDVNSSEEDKSDEIATASVGPTSIQVAVFIFCIALLIASGVMMYFIYKINERENEEDNIVTPLSKIPYILVAPEDATLKNGHC